MTSTSGTACPEKFHPYVYFLFSLNYLFQSGYSLGCRHPPATSTALMARIQNICIFINNIHIFIKNGKNTKDLHFHQRYSYFHQEWQEYKIFAFSSKIFIFPSRMARLQNICIFIFSSIMVRIQNICPLMVRSHLLLISKMLQRSCAKY